MPLSFQILVKETVAFLAITILSRAVKEAKHFIGDEFLSP